MLLMPFTRILSSQIWKKSWKGFCRGVNSNTLHSGRISNEKLFHSSLANHSIHHKDTKKNPIIKDTPVNKWKLEMSWNITRPPGAAFLWWRELWDLKGFKTFETFLLNRQYDNIGDIGWQHSDYHCCLATWRFRVWFLARNFQCWVGVWIPSSAQVSFLNQRATKIINLPLFLS